MLLQILNKINFWSKPVKREPTIEEQFERYQLFALDRIKKGKLSAFKLTPHDIWLNISENCNLKCVGCYTEDKFKKEYSTLDEVRKAIQVDGDVRQISFTTNEALLHPQFCEIIDLCRDTHPTARLWIITNGTIPIKGRYRNAIAKLNKVSLSIDGATKEVYEGIRIGANFEDFIKNTKDIISIRDESDCLEEITFGFTATATNLHELKDLVTLAHSLGIDNVWAQAMEAKGDIIEARIADILIERLDPAIRTRYIDEAKAQAAALGIGLYYSEGLYPIIETKHEIINVTDAELHVKMCQYPWIKPVQIARYKDAYLVRPCCYIPTTKQKALAENHNMVFTEILSTDEIYNSPQMWQFRESLVNGKANDVCGNCSAARGFKWQPET